MYLCHPCSCQTRLLTPNSHPQPLFSPQQTHWPLASASTCCSVSRAWQHWCPSALPVDGYFFPCRAPVWRRCVLSYRGFWVFHWPFQSIDRCPLKVAQSPITLFHNSASHQRSCIHNGSLHRCCTIF